MISRPPKTRVRFEYVLGAAPVRRTSPAPVFAQEFPPPPLITPLRISVPADEPIWLSCASPPLLPMPLRVIGPDQVLTPARLSSAPSEPGAALSEPLTPAPPIESGSA